MRHPIFALSFGLVLACSTAGCDGGSGTDTDTATSTDAAIDTGTTSDTTSDATEDTVSSDAASDAATSTDASDATNPNDADATVDTGEDVTTDADVDVADGGDVAPTGWTVGGTVSGLDGTLRLELREQLVVRETLDVTADGTFAFDWRFDEGDPWRVVPAGQPDGQLCGAQNDRGSVETADIRDVDFGCRVHELEIVNTSASGMLADDTNVNSNVLTSHDGRWIGFASDATNLVDGQTMTQAIRLWLKDMDTGAIVRADSTHAGAEPDDNGFGHDAQLDVSDDGRYVAFASRASNLVDHVVDDNAAYDVFRRDLQSGEVWLASKGTAAIVGDGSARPERSHGFLSGDGGVIGFTTNARNVQDGVCEFGQSNVFLKNIAAGPDSALTRLSMPECVCAGCTSCSPNCANQIDSNAILRQLAASGTTAVLRLLYTNGAVANDDGQGTFVWNSGGFFRVNAGLAGDTMLNPPVADTWTTDDGKTAVFVATGFDGTVEDSYVAGCEGWRVYRKNLATGELECLDRQWDGSTDRLADASSRTVSVSGDGRFVAFSSQQTLLDPLCRDLPTDSPQVFVLDTATDEVACVSVASTGEIADYAGDVYISGNGQWVTFNARGAEMHPSDTGRFWRARFRARNPFWTP